MANGLLKVVQPETVKKELDISVEELLPKPEAQLADLASFIRTRWDYFRRFRYEVLATATSGSSFTSNDGGETLNDRLLASLRSYQGKYSPQKLAEIGQFGGSQVFSKITTVKCRGATAMLRDIFLNGDRTWDLAPTPDPELPNDISGSIDELVMSEVIKLQQAGQSVDMEQVNARKQELMQEAEKATRKQADKEAMNATLKVDDMLVEGGFYTAMQEFLTDLPIFYLACIKGPVVQMVKQVDWVDGEAVTSMQPKMFWYRVSPFDLYWTPGVARFEDAEIIEKVRYTRAELNSLIGVPGFIDDNIKAVLTEFPDGYMEYPDEFESERSDLESREDMHLNRSGLLEGLEFHGSVQGKTLIDSAGFSAEEISDPELDYSVRAWQIAGYVLKVQLNPNPRERHPYYVSSFEKVPGSVVGNGVTDIIDDIQDVANASLRSLVNNMSISSGPQVAVNEERLGPNTDANTLYPWKRWRFEDDPINPGNNGTPPISFFQPQSNANELLQVYNAMSTIADETSAIPRYMTGGKSGSGGAASTASGLSMLMNNASKVLQNVAAQIDVDIYKPILEDLYAFIMLTDTTGMLKGDESIQVKGVTVAMQKEQDRMRKLEYLNMTVNPIDSQIIGPTGRAAILRDLAQDLGMPGDKIVPSEQELMAQQQQAAQQQTLPPGDGNQAPNPSSGERPAQELDNAFRTQQ